MGDPPDEGAVPTVQVGVAMGLARHHVAPQAPIFCERVVAVKRGRVVLGNALLARARRPLGCGRAKATVLDARGSGASQGNAWPTSAVRSPEQIFLSLLLSVLLPVFLHQGASA